MRVARVARAFGYAIVVAALAGRSRLDAQTASTDSARCDSLIAREVVDSVITAIYVSVQEIGTDWMTPEQRDEMQSSISGGFVAPRPLRLSVFEGPSLVRGLRISSSGDSLGVPRAPSILGAYRLDVSDDGGTDGPVVIRSSLLPGFDAAVVAAIRSAYGTGPVFRPTATDRWHLQIYVSTDSLDGARRLAQGTFPRMRVRDASATPQRRPLFPADARADSIEHGETVLRFVVDRTGKPALETVEIVRVSAFPFARAAVVTLATSRFNPATIGGCPVAQLVEFPFVFDADDRRPVRIP